MYSFIRLLGMIWGYNVFTFSIVVGLNILMLLLPLVFNLTVNNGSKIYYCNYLYTKSFFLFLFLL